MIDLQPFCGVDEIFRNWLNAPFSIGEHTYATNGRILVRVDRRAGVADLQAKANIPAVLAGFDDTVLAPLVVSLPPPAADDDEIGDDAISTTLRGAIYALNYVRLIAALPDIAVAVSPPAALPLFFRFTGGVGALMPMRGHYGCIVEVER